MHNKCIRPFFIFLLTLAGGLTPSAAFAATLYLSPSSGTHAVGETFRVSLVVSSADQAMNAVNASLSYPADLLSITSVSKSGSVLTYWVEEPSYSNANGTVNLQGVVTNPGYTGSSGTVASVTFRVKGTGTAKVSIGSGSQVLANDGNGTDILSSAGSGTYTLVAAISQPQPKPKPKPVAPAGDTTPPEPFSITFPEGTPTEDPAVKASFVTVDTGSGMDHYEYAIDGGSYALVGSGSSTQPLVLLEQKLGKHTLVVRAFDKAGNTREAKAEFVVIPLKAPAITKYPDHIRTGTPFVIEGTSPYSGATATILIRDPSGRTVISKNALVGTSGTFAAVFDEKIARGSYSIAALVTDTRKLVSNESASVKMSVTYDWLTMAWMVLNALTFVLLVFLVLFALYRALLWLLAWWKKRKREAFLRHLRHDVAAMDMALSKLDKDLAVYVKYLQRVQSVRKLSVEEQSLLDLYNERITLETLHSSVSTMDAAVGVRSHVPKPYTFEQKR